MTEQPEVVVTTPRRRFRIHLPNKTQLKTAGAALTGVAVGALVTARVIKRECACEPDTTETADQPTS
jgi:hypothetical protein